MNKSMLLMMFLMFVLGSTGVAQQRSKDPMVIIHVKKKGKPDSLVVKVGNSRVAVIIRDTADLKALRHFDIQELVDDMIDAAMDGDSSALRYSDEYLKNIQEMLLDEQEEILREQEEVLRESEEMAKKRTEQGNGWANLERERELHARLRKLAERERELVERNRRSWENFNKEEWKDLMKDKIQLEKDRMKDNDHDDDDCDDCGDDGRKYRKTTYQSFNIDLGLNNYLSGGKFVDADNAPYTVRPLGSWYVGANSVYRTRLARKLFIEWGLGGSIYNFKFQNDSLRVIRDANGVQFVNDTREADYRKSKLTAGYLQASFVPVIDFGANKYKPGVFNGRSGRSLRFGVGPYAGYRVLGYTKQYYRIDGDKKRDRNHDNFYLNNLRYGIRAQIGFRDTDLFFTYDLNELFAKGKGPSLNAFSFGISF
ncbi:MAG: hypothetical protein ACKO3B_11940 [Bacteroidota bacterium]